MTTATHSPSVSARQRQVQLLWRDIRGAMLAWRFWCFMGWNDVAKQYRRTFLGPVWIALHTALFIIAFGLIGAQLFKYPPDWYLPYFCAGHVLFGYFSALINEGCLTYIGADAFLKQTPYPKMAFVFRTVFRCSLLMLHSAVIVLAVLLWSGRLGDVQWWALLGAAALTLAAACFVVAILGGLATRFRDVTVATGSLMQVSFFVTPVLWVPDQLTERAQWVVHLNPLALFLDLVRSPLMGTVPSMRTWGAAGGMVVLLALVFFWQYVVIRRRIVYWL
ncbi:ABC transporter permease [Acidovorax sp. sif1233]|uniref:ABC transporter permease n=1 Tax=unclassified Acidovorax TaxID=2684926 RepID=UPI001C495B6A|nr:MULTISPECIES: ABC transporter permease [unclassified Acidovorax]MBV7429209.1 ABC transporter permease [Acidovorax sp. sif0732]MBV7451035.1 ABC transporter permease [Acidovorax sp. sif0715]MBV7453996.1 ABC transporter permease [Acidovorax sp. sif1233]